MGSPAARGAQRTRARPFCLRHNARCAWSRCVIGATLLPGLRSRVSLEVLVDTNIALIWSGHNRGRPGTQLQREVFFSGYNGYKRDAVAKGWLRASQRELDQSRSTPLRPYLSHARIQKLRPGEI